MQYIVADAIIYGFPLYRVPTEPRVFRAPFVKVNLHNDVIVNAYRYLVYKFSQYAYLSKRIAMRNYDPSTGMMDVELSPIVQVDAANEIRLLYGEFISKYLVPRLVESIRKAKLDNILSVFYRRYGEGSQTGLSSVVLPAKHVEAYITEVISGRKYAIQDPAKRSLAERADMIRASLARLNLKDDDIVVVDKHGDVERLDENSIEEELKALPSVPDISADVKSIKRAKKCCYCGTRSTKMWCTATGKLGLGRYKLPHEMVTDFTREARICLRCVLVALYYVLDTEEKVAFYTYNNLLGMLRLDKRLNEHVQAKRRGEREEKITSTDIALALTEEISKSLPGEWSEALVLNSAFGDERARVSIEGFDEVSLERLALLVSLFSSGLLANKNAQRVLLGYARGSFSSLVTYLSYFLKQSEKGGGMSYVSKEIHRYITPHLYRETEDMRVAYTVAAVAESVVYNLKQAGADDYTIGKFADTLKSGLTTAIAYALSRIGKELRTLRIPDYADRTIVKEVLDNYGFSYEEKEGALYVHLSSIPPAEIRIRESHGSKVFLKAQDMLALLAPSVVVGTTVETEKKEEERGEEVATR